MGLAIASVPKDRKDLDSSHISTTKFLQKIRLIADLKGDDAKPEMFTDIQWILSCMVEPNNVCNHLFLSSGSVYLPG